MKVLWKKFLNYTTKALPFIYLFSITTYYVTTYIHIVYYLVTYRRRLWRKTSEFGVVRTTSSSFSDDRRWFTEKESFSYSFNFVPCCTIYRVLHNILNCNPKIYVSTIIKKVYFLWLILGI